MLANKAKYLKYSEDHFEDYMVQLTSLIRTDDNADRLLDGLLENPIITNFVKDHEGLAAAAEAFHNWTGDTWSNGRPMAVPTTSNSFQISATGRKL